MKAKVLIIFCFIIALGLLLKRPEALALETSNVTGWVWNASTGWISLSCGNQNSCEQSNYGMFINLVSGKVTGYIWSQYLGWICLGETCSGTPPEGEALAALDKATGRFSGWAKIINWQSNNDSGWIKLAGKAKDGNEYYVKLDQEKLTIQGWAWHGDPESQGRIGWLSFNSTLQGLSPEIPTPPTPPPAITATPWFQTRYGDIYSGGNIGSTFSSQGSRFNASYLIQAGGKIVNFNSTGTVSQPGTSIRDWLYEDFNKIDFPSPENKYTNVLGRLDVDGIINNGQTGLGKYGMVQKYSGQELTQPTVLGTNPLLAGKIYYFQGSCEVNEPLVIKNGIGQQNGAGIIFIDGDLRLNQDVVYAADQVIDNVKNLAVLVWVVRGNVYISPEVEKVVGAFVVLPDARAKGGAIYTGEGNKQLQIEGLIIAYQINFQRYYAEGGQPAELVIYDGRILANTHPAIKDFSAVLPIWREGQ